MIITILSILGGFMWVQMVILYFQKSMLECNKEYDHTVSNTLLFAICMPIGSALVGWCIWEILVATTVITVT